MTTPKRCDYTDDYGHDLTPAEIRELIDDSTYQPKWPWLAGCARYADPVALRQRALVAFLSSDEDHQREITRIIMDAVADPATSTGSISARAAFIRLIEDPNSARDALLVDAAPETIERLGGIEACRRMDDNLRMRRLADKAADHLATRGYDLFAVLDLAAILHGEPEQCAGRLLAALDAGITPADIAAAGWPAEQAIDTLAGLRC